MAKPGPKTNAPATKEQQRKERETLVQDLARKGIKIFPPKP